MNAIIETATPELEAEAASVDTMVTWAEQLAITTAADYEKAGEGLRRIKARAKELAWASLSPRELCATTAAKLRSAVKSDAGAVSRSTYRDCKPSRWLPQSKHEAADLGRR